MSTSLVSRGNMIEFIFKPYRKSKLQSKHSHLVLVCVIFSFIQIAKQIETERGNKREKNRKSCVGKMVKYADCTHNKHIFNIFYLSVMQIMKWKKKNAQETQLTNNINPQMRIRMNGREREIHLPGYSISI